MGCEGPKLVERGKKGWKNRIQLEWMGTQHTHAIKGLRPVRAGALGCAAWPAYCGYCWNWAYCCLQVPAPPQVSARRNLKVTHGTDMRCLKHIVHLTGSMESTHHQCSSQLRATSFGFIPWPQKWLGQGRCVFWFVCALQTFRSKLKLWGGGSTPTTKKCPSIFHVKFQRAPRPSPFPNNITLPLMHLFRRSGFQVGGGKQSSKHLEACPSPSAKGCKTFLNIKIPFALMCPSKSLWVRKSCAEK